MILHKRMIYHSFFIYNQLKDFLISKGEICKLDMNEIILEKVWKNAEKYPAEQSYGSKVHRTERITPPCIYLILTH